MREEEGERKGGGRGRGSRMYLQGRNTPAVISTLMLRMKVASNDVCNLPNEKYRREVLRTSQSLFDLHTNDGATVVVFNGIGAHTLTDAVPKNSKSCLQ